MNAVEDQREVLAFLGDPATYGLNQPILRIDTHGASVFLAGPDAYKVKRAVRYPFMDFSTLEKRRRACEREIAVNKANAPAIYLGVVPLTRAAGRLRLGGCGEIVDWAVHMRRFDENSTLDRLACRGELGREVVPQLAATILDAHRRAPIRDGRAATAALKNQVKATLDELGQHPSLFAQRTLGRLSGAVWEHFGAVEPLLLDRGERGQVRHCHGDLHLRNIVLIDGRPVLFDAIEFDDAFATCDVLFDLAFLVMDMWARGLRGEANLLLNRYLWGSDDEAEQISGLQALPLFLSLRAAIRAKVAADLAQLAPERCEAAVADAKRYFAAALDCLEPRVLRLIGVGGLSGTGKSTLAAALAPFVGRPPGAVHLRSDIERKRLFGMSERESLPQAAYAAEVSDQVYGRINEVAAVALAAGASAVVDAVHAREEEREAVARTARSAGAAFLGLWLEAPVETLRRRVANRTGDASDATPAVVEAQAGFDLGAMTWVRLGTSEPCELVVRKALALCTADATRSVRGNEGSRAVS